jgi:hypothetical protein
MYCAYFTHISTTSIGDPNPDLVFEPQIPEPDQDPTLI